MRRGLNLRQCDGDDPAILAGRRRIVLATLLGEAAEPLRKRDYHALRTLSVSPR